MFEPKSTQASQGDGVPERSAEDMFSSTDSLRQTGRPSPFVVKNESNSQNTSSPGSLVIEEESGGRISRSGGKGVLVFIVVVIIVGIAVGGLAFFLTKKNNQTQELDVNGSSGLDTSPQENQEGLEPNTSGSLDTDNSTTTDVTNTGQEQPSDLSEEQPAPVTRNVNLDQANVNIPLPGTLDRDGDGLTLDDEGVLGTSDNLSDTDLDALSDWDEVKVYHSDPLNPDTDGDGYVDGSEVKKGYSPIINGE